MAAIRESLSLPILMKNIFQIPVILISAVLVFVACAQQGAPTGGPEDVDPPTVLESSPENYSINFEENRIQITFDEFLNMTNFTQELVVSPPMEEKPVIKMKNKTLIIDFEEELKEDVTYTFNFGEGISDLNEGNTLLNYEYVFSTGNYLDSLSIKGTLRNALDLTAPEPPIFVMLYRELADTMPLTTIPYYVGRTDKEGNFAVNNLKEGVYKMFVLKDGNNNFLFDLPSEQIAFLDTSVIVNAEYYRDLLFSSGMYDSTDLQPDTLALAVDTAGMSPDSIAMVLDSLEQQKPDFNTILIDMYMFTEDPVNQYITDYKRDDRKKMELTFNLPLTDSFAFSPIIPDTLKKNDLIADFGQRGDSLLLWAADTLVASLDTIGLKLKYTVLDTLGNHVFLNDTLLFTFRETSDKKKDNSEDSKPKKGIKVRTIGNGGKHHLLKDLLLTIEAPVKYINTDKMEFFTIPDTVEMPITVNPYIDTNHLHRVRIPYAWEEEGSYKMALYPGAIFDVYGGTNDTLISNFSIKPTADYGIINLTLNNVSDTLLIEVYRRDVIYRKRTVTEDGIYIFEFLDPDTYRIKFVHDRNNNGKWDTGKYIEGIQPEKVEYIRRDVKVRANWDHDIEYTLGTNDSPPGGPEETAEE